MAIAYARDDALNATEFIDLLTETSMAPNRPLQNRNRIENMLRGSNFVVTARDESGRLVGIARCITDFEWICYCAELAVRESHQGKGIGRELLQTGKKLLGPGICLTLNADPAAESFYQHIGLHRYSAFYMPREDWT